METYYLSSPKMSSFCAYLTQLLHITDPLSWLMSARPVLVGKEGEVERWTLAGRSLAYPLGANGFLFRRSDLEAVHQGKHLFQDTHVALHLMESGRREWLRIRGRGVHHYYTHNLWSFLKKRRRAIAHYANVRAESGTSWANRPAVPRWLAALYCMTVDGPLYHALLGVGRDRDIRWLWHVPASFCSLVGTVWGLQTQHLHRHNKRLVAQIQPRQTLRAAPEPAAPRDLKRVAIIWLW